MDLDTRSKSWKIINDLRKECCIILTTQRIDEADFLADRCCVMSKGEVTQLASPAELKRQFATGCKLVLEHRDPESFDESLGLMRKKLHAKFDRSKVWLTKGKFKDIFSESNVIVENKRLIYKVPKKSLKHLTEIMEMLEDIDDDILI